MVIRAKTLFNLLRNNVAKLKVERKFCPYCSAFTRRNNYDCTKREERENSYLVYDVPASELKMTVPDVKRHKG